MNGMLRAMCAASALLAASLAPNISHAAESIAIGGTGSAIGVFKQLAEAYARHNPSAQVEVLDGLGSGGGIKAVKEGAIGMSASGRDLKPEEREAGLQSIAWYTTPMVFVTSHQSPNGFKAADLAGIYSDPAAKWADGTAIRIVLRPVDDSTTKWLAKNFPGMEAALKQTFERTEVPVAGHEGENLDLAETLPGSLAASVLSAVRSEQRRVRTVSVDGVEPTPENLAAGTYPYPNPVYLVLPGEPSAETQNFLAFLATPEAAEIVRQAGGIMDMPVAAMTQ